MEHIHTQITSATLVLLLCVALLWINISKGQGLTKIFSWLSPALFSLRTLFLKNEYYFYRKLNMLFLFWKLSICVVCSMNSIKDTVKNLELLV